MDTRVPAPFRDGLFVTRPDGTVRLLASRRTDDGRVHYPRMDSREPGAAPLEEIEIGPGAELFSFSRVHMPTANFKPPYTAGIGLIEGVRVFAPIVHDEGWIPAVGASLTLRALELPGGRLAYAFHPATEAN